MLSNISKNKDFKMIFLKLLHFLMANYPTILEYAKIRGMSHLVVFNTEFTRFHDVLIDPSSNWVGDVEVSKDFKLTFRVFVSKLFLGVTLYNVNLIRYNIKLYEKKLLECHPDDDAPITKDELEFLRALGESYEMLVEK